MRRSRLRRLGTASSFLKIRPLWILAEAPRCAVTAERSQSLRRGRCYGPGRELSVPPDAHSFSRGNRSQDLKNVCLVAQVSQPSPHSSVILKDGTTKNNPTSAVEARAKTYPESIVPTRGKPSAVYSKRWEKDAQGVGNLDKYTATLTN